MRRTRTRSWRTRSESSLLIGLVLRTFDRFQRPLRAFGIDYPRFRAVLELKLLLDVSVPLSSGRDGGFASVGLVIAALGFGFFGIPAGLFALLQDDAFLWVAGCQGALMFLLGAVLVMQYGQMLVDTTDLRFLGPLPVSDRTLFAARLAHVTVYVAILAASFSFGPLFLGMFAHKPWVVLPMFPIVTALSAGLTVSLVGMFYAVLLRLVGPRWFQRAATALQITVSAMLFGGMYVLPRLVPRTFLVELLEERPGVLYLFPPAHFGGLFELALGELTARNGLLAALALALPLLCLLVSFRLASKHFQLGLAGALEGAGARRRGWGSGPFSRLGRFVTRSQEERAGYDFALASSRRELAFVRGGYAQLVGFSLMGVGVILPWGGGIGHNAYAPLVLYVSLMLFPGLFEMAQPTSHPQATWLFRALPVERMGSVHCGALKGVLFGTLFPALAVYMLLILVISGPSGIPDLVIAALLITISLFVALGKLQLSVPFTRHARTGDFGMNNVTVMLGLAVIMIALVGLHVVLRLHPLTQYGAIAVLVPVLVRQYRGLERLTPKRDP